MARNKGLYAVYIKRFLDILFSCAIMLIFWWVYVILAMLVAINLGTPILFTQDRPGKDGRVFKLYKFRSMSDARDSNGILLPDNMRLGRFGRVLRSTSLDEIPELFNVLIGDMSLIGPRPLLVKYLDQYNDYERRRHEVRPGLTGLSQISGRNAASWKMRFLKDVEYVDHISFCLDLKIFCMTFLKIFKREGIEYKNNGTIYDYFNSPDRLTM